MQKLDKAAARVLGTRPTEANNLENSKPYDAMDFTRFGCLYKN